MHCAELRKIMLNYLFPLDMFSLGSMQIKLNWEPVMLEEMSGLWSRGNKYLSRWIRHFPEHCHQEDGAHRGAVSSRDHN